MHASLYEELYEMEQRHWWFLGRRRIVHTLIERYAKAPHNKPLTIYELGCGAGGNLASLADRHNVLGVDASPQALKFAQRQLGSRVAFGELPDKISLPTESADVVLLTDVFEHLEDDHASAQTALSLVRPGGVLVATVPAYQWLYSPRDRHHQHYRRYSKRAFRRLFESNDVQLELLSYYNAALFPPAAIARLASKLTGRRSVRDLSIPPRPLNRLLTAIFSGESNLLGRLNLPWGLSLIAVARKSRQAR